MPFDGSLQSEQAVATHEDWDLQGLSWDRRAGPAGDVGESPGEMLTGGRGGLVAWKRSRFLGNTSREREETGQEGEMRAGKQQQEEERTK